MENINDFIKDEDVANGNCPTTAAAAAFGYIIVTECPGVIADGTTDVADALQRVIDENPNRTIFFPDGVYLIGHSIATPADPKKSVDLQLSNYAILRAAADWHEENTAVVRLGGKDAFNDINTPGSNYSFTGGIVDGNGIANGISIDSGRETVIHHVSIKNTVVGIHIKRGANAGSSDADIHNVNIVGRGGPDSIGVFLDGGMDNTVSNMRIANVCIGMKIISGGNIFRSIHPLGTLGENTPYDETYGFLDLGGGNNWYDYCYSDHFRYGFGFSGRCSNVYDNCFCFWWCDSGAQTGFRSIGPFNSLIKDFKVGFWGDSTERTVLKEDTDELGKGDIGYVSTYTWAVKNDSMWKYLDGKLLPLDN